MANEDGVSAGLKASALAQNQDCTRRTTKTWQDAGNGNERSGPWGFTPTTSTTTLVGGLHQQPVPHALPLPYVPPPAHSPTPANFGQLQAAHPIKTQKRCFEDEIYSPQNSQISGADMHRFRPLPAPPIAIPVATKQSEGLSYSLVEQARANRRAPPFDFENDSRTKSLENNSRMTQLQEENEHLKW